MGSGAAEEFKEGAKPWSLWAGVLTGPTAMLIELEVNYALVNTACRSAVWEWALHAVSFLALALTIGALALSWRNWKLAGGGWEDDGAGVMPRSRFMTAVGIMMSALISLVIIAQWIAVFTHGPCQRWW